MRLGRLVVTIAVGLTACEDASPRARPSVATSSPPAPPVAPSIVPPAPSAAAPDPPPSPTPRTALKRLGTSVVDDSPGKWASHCSIHRPCKIKAKPIPDCAPGQTAENWSTFAAKADHLTDPRVSVRGRLVVQRGMFSTGAACRPQGSCCNHTRATFALEGPPVDLELVGWGCAGDESRLCCNAFADGQAIIATGDVRWDTGQWSMEPQSLCAVKE
ncbi:MAG: hypothetical protein EOO73_30655 [Myxococcales bacterium]|nr:MAG: hypothetical protein EOO73_30655 [Myxococcales bacterium]